MGTPPEKHRHNYYNIIVYQDESTTKAIDLSGGMILGTIV